jgi:hypothetical protein
MRLTPTARAVIFCASFTHVWFPAGCYVPFTSFGEKNRGIRGDRVSRESTA